MINIVQLCRSLLMVVYVQAHVTRYGQIMGCGKISDENHFVLSLEPYINGNQLIFEKNFLSFGFS